MPAGPSVGCIRESYRIIGTSEIWATPWLEISVAKIATSSERIVIPLRQYSAE